MKLNQNAKIDEQKGDYLILIDNGSEGISIGSQHKALDEAIKNLGVNNYGTPQTIVKLVELSVTTHD